MEFKRLNYIQGKLNELYKKHKKKIYTLAILTTINLLLSISIFFHVIPTDTVPLRRLIKNDLQTLNKNTTRFKWLNKAYIDTNDVFVTLPSGSCSQVNNETFHDAISPFISFFTTDNADEYELGQKYIKYIKQTDYNEVDIGKKAIDQLMFIETTTTSAPSTTTTSAPLIEIFDLRKIDYNKFKSCKFYADDHIDKVATVGSCTNTCEKDEPECYRNEYCYIASKGAADICRPGLYYDFCIIAGYKSTGFSFTYENASDNNFYLVAFIGAISCIFNSAVFMFLFYYKAFRSNDATKKDNKCQKRFTNCCLKLCFCQKGQKAIDKEVDKRYKERMKKIAERLKLNKSKVLQAEQKMLESMADDNNINNIPALQDERHIRFDFSGPDKTNSNETAEDAEGAEKTTEGAQKKTQCCDKLPKRETCWNGIKWAILILVFVTDVVILYCFCYSYFALVGVQSSDSFFQPNNYEQKDEHAVFDNIHPNISPALTEMFTVAMFFIVWWLHLVLSVVRLFVGGLIFKQSRDNKTTADDTNTESAARYGRYEMVGMSDDNCNELRF